MQKFLLSLLACAAFVSPAEAGVQVLMNVTGDATGSTILPYGPWAVNGYINFDSAWWQQNNLVDALPGSTEFTFWSADNSGGMTFTNGGVTLIDAVGPQLFYTDSNNAGYFGVKTFHLLGNDDPTKHYTVTFTDVDDGGPALPPFPAVPEPSSWLLMIAGFGVVGCAMRGRKSAISFG